MKKVNAKKYIIEVNKKYGPYLTIDEVVTQGKKSIERMWNVVHVVTGKKHLMRPSYLNRVSKKYNETLLRGNYQQGLKSYLFKQTIRNSKLRNHEFNLSFDDYINLIIGNCYYCGLNPPEVTNKTLIMRGHVNEPPFFYNGIDRLNPNLGYSLDNCVTSCSICNYMKHTQQHDDFISQIRKITNHLKII
jgi:hypothetical protein